MYPLRILSTFGAVKNKAWNLLATPTLAIVINSRDGDSKILFGISLVGPQRCPLLQTSVMVIA